MATANALTLGIEHIVEGRVNWLTDTIKAMAVGTGWVPNQNTHDFRDDLGANEITGTNWPAGGVTLAGKTSAIDAATRQVRLDANDIVVASVTMTGFRYIVYYKARGGAASADELIGWTDLGAAQTITAATFELQFDATGLIRFDVALAT